MTLPHERYASLMKTKDFLYDLLDRQKTPRVPLVVRQQARHVLRHWPDSYILDNLCDKTPEYFARSIEDVFPSVSSPNRKTKPNP